MKLLSNGITNPKILKSITFNKNYLSYILHLAPSNVSGFNVCKQASPGCIKTCLNTSGNGGRFTMVQTARIRKTKYLFENTNEFMYDLWSDIAKAKVKADKNEQTLVIRLNGTSDIDWSNYPIKYFANKNIFELFPDVQFYDYTKDIRKLLNNNIPNYHLTFSLSEINLKQAKLALSKGFNVAVVFDHTQPMPIDFLGYSVIDGTTHDLRFLDAKGVIVGLKALGKAKKDDTGFVIRSCNNKQLKLGA